MSLEWLKWVHQLGTWWEQCWVVWWDWVMPWVLWRESDLDCLSGTP